MDQAFYRYLPPPARSTDKSILIVDDDEDLCRTLVDRLRNEGYQVECVSDGAQGLEKISHCSFDLVILDVVLPTLSGLGICMFARRIGVTTPILFLTAKSQIADRIIGLKLGADAYMAKPFDSMELLARIEALLRRPNSWRARTNPDCLQFASITLDLRRAHVIRNGQPVYLSSKEFLLLRYLAERPELIVSREELLRHVWDHKLGTLTRTVDMHVASIRQKLQDDSKDPQIIETIWKLGYRFVSPQIAQAVLNEPI
jgi:DNA-binding response OmpR family regulator